MNRLRPTKAQVIEEKLRMAQILRDLLPKGSRVYSVTHEVTRNGMHVLSFYCPATTDPSYDVSGWSCVDITLYIARVLDYRMKDRSIRAKYTVPSEVVQHLSEYLYDGESEAIRNSHM